MSGSGMAGPPGSETTVDFSDGGSVEEIIEIEDVEVRLVRQLPFRSAGCGTARLALIWLWATPCVGAQELPEFELAQLGRAAVSNASLEGATTIVAFTYAKCIFACPMITFQLGDLDQDLESPPGIRYLHISVNPAEDTRRGDPAPLRQARHRSTSGSALDVRQRSAGSLEPSCWLDDLGIEVKRTQVEGGYLIEHTILVLVVGPDGSTEMASFDTYNWDQEELHAMSYALPPRMG